MKNGFENLLSFAKENILTISLSVIYFLFLFLYWGHFGNPVIDCGREAYIPYDMATHDKVLFKDIVCIYGPLPYMLNAFFMKTLSINLNVLYSAGGLLGFAFTLLFYLISKEFLEKSTSFIITLFVLFSCVFSIWIFNFVFPYSYATVYAAAFLALYIFSLIKYLKTSNISFLYCAAFAFSIVVLSKYDFIPAILSLLLILFLKRKELSLKAISYNVAIFVLPILAVVLVLLFQGVRLEHLVYNFKIIANMADSNSLKTFYSSATGFIFNKLNFTTIFLPFLKYIFVTFLLFALAFLSSHLKNKFLKYTTAAFLIALFSIFFINSNGASDILFIYITLFVSIVLIFETLRLIIKRNTIEKSFFPYYILLLTVLLISLKTFFALTLSVYGTYYLPFLFLALIVFVSRYQAKFKTNTNFALNAVILVFTIVYFVYGFVSFMFIKNHPIVTKMGTLYSTENFTLPTNLLVEFMQKKAEKNDNIVVLPEGLFINFMLDKQYDFYNTSFIPLDFDAYGENYLTKKFADSMPEYVAITNRDTEEYGQKFICTNYGKNFCAFIFSNYVMIKAYGRFDSVEAYKILLFKKMKKAQKND